MVVKKTRAKVAKGGCLVGLKGKAKGCKIGRTAPHNVGKEKNMLVKKKTKPMIKSKPKRMTARELQEHNEMERRKSRPNEGVSKARKYLAKGRAKVAKKR